MTAEVVTVSRDTPLKEAARLMTRFGVSGVPVVDGEHRLVGILSEADFVSRSSRQGRGGRGDTGPGGGGHRLGGDSVGGAMTRNVLSIDPESDHRQAARLMMRRRVRRLPVVDAQGRLLGIISRSDILSVFARPDDEIREEIERHIIGQVLAVEPHTVAVRVEDGRVEMSGTLPARTDAELLTDLARNVDGVITVVGRLGYLVDDTTRAAEARPYGVPRPNW